MERASAVAAFCASHGGVHQRAASVSAASAAEIVDSPLADLLEELFAWGDIKATVVSRIARAGVAEVQLRGSQASARLLKLATGSKGHERKWLLRALAPSPEVPKPARIRVPCVPLRTNNAAVSFVSTKMFLINEVMEALFQGFPNRFADFLGGGLRNFWERVDDIDPRLVGHPMLGRASWMDRAIPMVIHGDGVAFTMKGNSLACLSVGGVLCSGWSLHSWLMACFPKNCRAYESVYGAGNDTWHTIYKYVTHSFNALFTGIHPPLDPFGCAWPSGSKSEELAGMPLCNGMFFGVVWHLSADREWVSNEWKFPHWNAHKCCGHCPVDRTDTTCDLAALWKLRAYTPANDPGVLNHPVWSLPGVSRYTFHGDWAHTVEGGIMLYLHLHCLTTIKGFACVGLNATAACRHLWRILCAAYGECGTTSRLQCLTPTMLDLSKTVMLKCKMNVSKNLVSPLLRVCRKYLDDSDASLHLILCYECLEGVFAIIDKDGLFVSDDDATELLRLCELFLIHYMACSSAHEWLMPVTNKFHVLYHIAYFARFQHPRAGWTYVWEDFVGRIQKIGMACTSGTPMHLVSDKIMDNYSVGVSHTLRVIG